MGTSLHPHCGCKIAHSYAGWLALPLNLVRETSKKLSAFVVSQHMQRLCLCRQLVAASPLLLHSRSSFALLLFPVHPHSQQLKQRTLLLNCIQQLLAIWWGSSAHCNVEFRLVLEVAFDEDTSRAEYVRKLRVKWYRQTESLWFENFLVLWANCSFHTQVQAASQHIFKLAVRLLVKIQLGKREACDEALIYSAL
jgi:hypothetical protein